MGVVQHVLNQSSDRIVPLVTAGRVFWLKRAAPARLGLAHHLQRAAAAILRIELLSFTAVTDGAASLAREARIIRKLEAKGARVPEVVLQGDDWIVLSDLGPSLEQQLKQAPSREAAVALAVNGAVALRRLHLAGAWHGFPLARNLAGPPQALGFIDFEEDPGRHMSPAQCRVRDFMLYLQSLGGCNTRHPGLTRAAAEAYLAVQPLSSRQVRTVRRIRWLCRAANPLGWALWPLRRKLGRDLRDALTLWHELRDLQPPAPPRFTGGPRPAVAGADRERNRWAV